MRRADEDSLSEIQKGLVYIDYCWKIVNYNKSNECTSSSSNSNWPLHMGGGATWDLL
jgi:hypothetical protein